MFRGRPSSRFLARSVGAAGLFSLLSIANNCIGSHWRWSFKALCYFSVDLSLIFIENGFEIEIRVSHFERLMLFMEVEFVSRD